MPHRPTHTVLLIVGLKSNRCREMVIEAVRLVQGVDQVEVNLCRGHALVTHDLRCGQKQLIEAIERAGYGAMLYSIAITQAPQGPLPT